MIAGPNGSGKSTLTAWLMKDYAVNFYTMLNADDVFTQVKQTAAIFARGFETLVPAEELPRWFAIHILRCFQK